MEYYITMITGLPAPPATPKELFQIAAPEKSLITSILSAGTCIGALIAGDCADMFGRRTTILGGCILFAIGVVLEMASTGVALMVAGRCIAGLGVGFESGKSHSFLRPPFCH
jgi:SP family sugar:H+ symporter-like MFS transporter